MVTEGQRGFTTDPQLNKDIICPVQWSRHQTTSGLYLLSFMSVFLTILYGIFVVSL